MLSLQISLCDTEYFDGRNHAIYTHITIIPTLDLSDMEQIPISDRKANIDTVSMSSTEPIRLYLHSLLF